MPITGGDFVVLNQYKEKMRDHVNYSTQKN